MKPAITREQLLAKLAYDPATGFFTWRETKGRARAGARAGSTNWDGYRRIKVNGHLYAEHRLVWLAEHGEFPTQEIDHIDRVRGNNQIANLRLVNRKTNMENTGRHGRNTSGFKGVGFSKATQKWRAFIGHNGKVKALGYFPTPEAASAAYQEARKKYFQINS